ncbi:MAG: hypothetical protein K2M07_00425 [Muribaculaceae bacterium]|nr:hypothetical protein [Muribaculaceae bacterium]
MKRPYLLLALVTPLILSASGNDSILIRMNSHVDGLRRFISETWQNPALKYFSEDEPFSNLSVGLSRRNDSEIITPEYGDGSHSAGFNAESFIPAGKNSAVWGNAGYSTGSTRNVQWCESSSPELIYPYFSADEAGGNLKDEHYKFSGGYAGRKNSIVWGATLGYSATHHFRDVDPRPRNITGELTLSGGIAYSISADYMVGASMNWMKYKQSNDIKFVSETHDLPIYQLTGLGTHYNRFAGASKSSDFSGNRFGATLNLFPLRSGVLVNISVSRFSFDKTLRDLNKLPIASAWHNALTVNAGYKHISDKVTYSVTGQFDAYRRHGSENIFGDAVSGSYPQIGSLEMYADNYYRALLQGFASIRQNNQTYSMTLRSGYSHRKQFYAEPEQWALVEGLENMADFSVRSFLGQHWYGIADLSFAIFSPTEKDINLQPSTSPEALAGSVETGLRHSTVTRCATSVSLTAARAISEKYAIGIGGSATLTNYSGTAHSNLYNISINFYF